MNVSQNRVPGLDLKQERLAAGISLSQLAQAMDCSTQYIIANEAKRLASEGAAAKHRAGIAAIVAARGVAVAS